MSWSLAVECAGPIWPTMSFYTRLQQIKRIQCAEEANITNISMSFSATTPWVGALG